MAKSNASDSGTKERNSGSSSEEEEEEEEESPVEPQRTGKLTDYEKQRMKRIEENRARMEAMGLHIMANSLMGSSQKPQKKGKDRKGKKKVVDEDEDYEPAQSEDLSRDTGEDDEQNDVNYEVSKSKLKKSKNKIQIPKKRVSYTTVLTDTDFVDDDAALMQAIALSLQDSAGFLNLANKVPMQRTDADSTNNDSNEKASLKKASNEKEIGTCNQEEATGKRKRKQQQTRNRVQMTEDDLIMHFFQFDEAGKGSISFRDLRKMAVSHDFIWSDEDMENMIRCFDSNEDGKYPLFDEDQASDQIQYRTDHGGLVLVVLNFYGSHAWIECRQVKSI